MVSSTYFFLSKQKTGMGGGGEIPLKGIGLFDTFKTTAFLIVANLSSVQEGGILPKSA